MMEGCAHIAVYSFCVCVCAGGKKGVEGVTTYVRTAYDEHLLPTYVRTAYDEHLLPTYVRTAYDEHLLPTYVRTAYDEHLLPTYVGTYACICMLDTLFLGPTNI